MIKEQLSERLAGIYRGDLVASDSRGFMQAVVVVETLSDLLVKISFEYADEVVEMRAILSEENGDIHLIIQEKVTDDFILNGVRGFLCQKPNVHGGYINELNGFYFHVLFNHFSGPYQEFYFFGKPTAVQAYAV